MRRVPPEVSKLINVAKYRHFDFDTGFDTVTRAKRPVFGGGEGGVSQKRTSLLKKSLSDHSVAQDSAEIPGNKTETLQKQRLLAPERAPENGTKEFFNTLDRFWYTAKYCY